MAEAHLDPELVSQYVDARLLGAELRAVEEHLGVCDLCRREAESLRRTVLLLRSLPSVPVPQSFALSGPQYEGRPRLLPRLYPVFAALSGLAAVALVLVITVDLLSQMSRAYSIVERQAGPSAAAPAADPSGEERTRPQLTAPKAQVREAVPAVGTAGEGAKKDAASSSVGPVPTPTGSGLSEDQPMRLSEAPRSPWFRLALAAIAVTGAIVALAARRAGGR